MDASSWYQVWSIFNPNNSIQIIIGVITLGIAIFSFISANAARNSAIAAKEMLGNEIKPLVAYNGKFIGGFETITKNIEGINYCRELLYFTNYGKGAAILRTPKLSNPDLRTDVGIPTTLGQGAETDIAIFLPYAETIYETDIQIYYWNIKEICYCTIFKCRINHTRNRGEMLRVISERFIEIGYKEMPSRIENYA